MLALLENLPKETLSTQLGYGAVLMLLGMATVFVFLTVLIYATKLMSKICGKIGKVESAKKKDDSPNSQSAAKPEGGDAAIAAAIAAAYDKSIS